MAEYRFDNFKIDANNPTGETPSSDVLNLNNDNLGSQEGMAQANAELQEKYNSINQQVASGQIKQKPQMN